MRPRYKRTPRVYPAATARRIRLRIDRLSKSLDRLEQARRLAEGIKALLEGRDK